MLDGSANPILVNVKSRAQFTVPWLSSLSLLALEPILYFKYINLIFQVLTNQWSKQNNKQTKMSEQEQPIYSPFFGVMGATSAMVFSAMGAAYGTAKSGT